MLLSQWDTWNVELPLMEEMRTPSLGTPVSCFPRLLCLHFGSPFGTGKNYARTGWPLDTLSLRFTSPTITPETCSSWNPETQNSSQGLKTAEEKRYIISFTDSHLVGQLSLTFRYSQG